MKKRKNLKLEYDVYWKCPDCGGGVFTLFKDFARCVRPLCHKEYSLPETEETEPQHGEKMEWIKYEDSVPQNRIAE